MKLSIDQQKMIFGFLLLLIIAGLVAIIAIGHVEEKSSFGLQPLEGCLLTLAGSFSTWAFTSRNKDE